MVSSHEARTPDARANECRTTIFAQKYARRQVVTWKASPGQFPVGPAPLPFLRTLTSAGDASSRSALSLQAPLSFSSAQSALAHTSPPYDAFCASASIPSSLAVVLTHPIVHSAPSSPLCAFHTSDILLARSPQGYAISGLSGFPLTSYVPSGRVAAVCDWFSGCVAIAAPASPS